MRAELGLGMGARVGEKGCLVVDRHQTSIPGLFAAGDVVVGLDQMRRVGSFCN